MTSSGPPDRAPVALAGNRPPPTAADRFAAALAAGTLAFLLTAFALWLSFGTGDGLAFFGAFAAAVAAATAALTTRVGLAVIFGSLAAMRLLLALVGAFIAAVAAALG